MTLKATGYDRTSKDRLNVFLTNSLEEASPRTADLFAKWLSDEADEASKVKSETPVMICTGNPPYSVSSQNNGKWITDLVADYKKNLAERNIQPLSDDYIKFIRLGQYYINKKGEGILAFISNNSFIDGIIHRQMRKSLLDEFDSIYILDLHGNSRKKEIAPDGTEDKNVFDIGWAGTGSYEMQEFITGAGHRCIVFESDAQVQGRKGLTAYITTGDIVYMCHAAFNAKDRADAEKIIHDWAESLK